MEELLVYYAIKYHGDYNQIKKAIIQQEAYHEEIIKNEISNLESNFITILSDAYPPSLMDLDSPPYVLFYYGDITLLNQTLIGMVGMRKPSEYGIKTTKQFSRYLTNQGYTIVSGMANGIDTIAHRTCIENQGKTIAILGSGIDYCYPKENLKLYKTIKENHLILSEYPGHTSPKPYYFPFRNRIVSALSKGVVVSEANKRSGTMITVSHALDLGKPVFCIPGSIYGYIGCLDLIRDGAILVRDGNDVIQELNS